MWAVGRQPCGTAGINLSVRVPCASSLQNWLSYQVILSLLPPTTFLRAPCQLAPTLPPYYNPTPPSGHNSNTSAIHHCTTTPHLTTSSPPPEAPLLHPLSCLSTAVLVRSCGAPPAS